jgi:hypothetical protein
MTTTTDCASSTFFPPRGVGSSTEPELGAAPAALSASPAVVVTVVGPAGSLAALAEHLPADWAVRPATPGQPSRTDVLVIAAATGLRIAEAVQRNPGIPVVGIVDALAPAETVVDVLEAGADACVRSGQPALVGSHLRACYRRRTLAA